MRPPIFEKSKINFIHCVDDIEVTSGWLFTSVCLFGLWCLTPFSTIFQFYRGGQFY
jgi:hypothetical protein